MTESQTLQESLNSTSSNAPLLFFDGVCGLCNWFVDFVMRRDKRQIFRFAPLQGETAGRYLQPQEITHLKSVVLRWNGQEFRHSGAIVRVLWLLGGLWWWAGWMLWFVPAPVRDLGYRLVASNRYSLFGKKESCRLPQPGELERLLP